MSNTCTLCSKKSSRYEITGTKTMKNNRKIGYQLCQECCKKLPPVSLYNPAISKKRRDFWNTVWKQLSVSAA